MKYLEKFKFQISLVCAVILIIASYYIPAPGFVGYTAKLFAMLFVLPVIVIGATDQRLSDFGLNVKDARRSIDFAMLFIAAAMPLVVYGSRIAELRAYYPIWSTGDLSPATFLYFELLTGAVMLATEFFYRGFLVFPFEKLGRFAWVPQIFPYVLVHIGKPLPEVFVAAAAGAAFGYMAYKTRSILPSFLSHWAVAVLFDILVLV